MLNTKLTLSAVAAIALLARVAMVNINAAEWGDSYRILRASNFIRHLSYPADEKRPPLFSAVLAVRPATVDAVVWGRVIMLGLSLLALGTFAKLAKLYLPTSRQQFWAVLLLAINPVYLYWSLRLYADVPFSLLVLVCCYVFEAWRVRWVHTNNHPTRLLVVMGVVCGLSILTRFEGYLLTLATVTGIVVVAKARPKTAVAFAAIVSVTTLAVILPWLVYRNPLTSAYFEEPGGRAYDLTMLATYAVSYLFVLGIIPAGALVVSHFNTNSATNLRNWALRYPHILSFVALESLLILAWPAAVPRLFVPIIPFVILAFVSAWQNRINWRITAGTALVLTVGYGIVQHQLRLQFIGSHTAIYICVTLLAGLGTVALALQRHKLFMLTAVLSMAMLTASTVYLHRTIYSSIKEIATFSAGATQGTIIHNDTAGIVSWYLPHSVYKNLDDKKYLTQAYLQENTVDYIILTNEFNPTMEIDLKKRPYLELVRVSKYTAGGKMFFTWLVQVHK
jgi:hypothetical protein